MPQTIVQPPFFLSFGQYLNLQYAGDDITVEVYSTASNPSVCTYTAIAEKEMFVSQVDFPSTDYPYNYTPKQVAVYCREGYSSTDFPNNPRLTF